MSISIITNLHEVIFYRTEAHKNVDTNYLSEQKYTYKSSDYQIKGMVRIFVWVCFLKSYPFLDGLFQWFNLLFYLLNFFFTCKLYKKPFPSSSYLIWHLSQNPLCCLSRLSGSSKELEDGLLAKQEELLCCIHQPESRAHTELLWLAAGRGWCQAWLASPCCP